MRIYDCFLFAGEHSMLKIRHDELKNLDVLHIAVESKQTFSGLPRKTSPYLGDEFARIIHHVISIEEDVANPWEREKRQRNYIKELISGYSPDDSDIIIISDVDEIPKASAVMNYKPEYGLCALQMDHFYYWLNGLCSRQSWIHPKIMTWGYLKDKEPDAVRRAGFDLALHSGGWHFSSCGGLDAVLEKFKAFSHQEQAIQQFSTEEAMKKKMDSLESVWGELIKLIPIDDSFPMYVQKNQDLLSNLIRKS